MDIQRIEASWEGRRPALSRSGAVSFDRPTDMQETEVGGVKNLWIRARINAGNYGAPGSYELQGANWVFKEDRPLRPPMLKTRGESVCSPKNQRAISIW